MNLEINVQTLRRHHWNHVLQFGSDCESKHVYDLVCVQTVKSLLSYTVNIDKIYTIILESSFIIVHIIFNIITFCESCDYLT